MDGEAGVCVGTLITIGGGELASGMSSAVRDPENAGRTARWSRVPELRPRVSLRPAPSRRPVPAEGAAPGQGAEVRVTSADVLEALHRASGLPIVADYYTRLHPVSSVTFENVTIYDALNRLSDAMRLRWSWEKDGGWLRFRSASYYDDRLKEVPNRLLARWSAARQRQNWLTLDDLTEIAQLTDVQLDSDTMAEGTRVLFDLQEWDLARSGNFRSHLRFLATLTPEQRRRTMDAAGLPFTALSRTQQQGLMTHLGERIPSLDVLTQLSIRVVYLQPGEFQWVQPGMSEFLGPHGRWPANFFNLPTVRDRTPQGVLLAARRIDPNADPAQIRPTELWLAVMFRQADPQTGKLKMEWGMAGTHAGGRLNW
jgi:hypothetical protein